MLLLKKTLRKQTPILWDIKGLQQKLANQG